MFLLQILFVFYCVGVNVGLYSVCCSNEQVLCVVMYVVLVYGIVLLIEVIFNQVDQFGGYIGMILLQYCDYVGMLVDEEGFLCEWLMLGGDYFGLNVWQKCLVVEVMIYVCVLIEVYVVVGFYKIYFDCSMFCVDDLVLLFDVIVVVCLVELVEIVECIVVEYGLLLLVYVIGIEVLIFGGEVLLVEGLQVIMLVVVVQILVIYWQVFDILQLCDVWQCVIVMVVQLGVDFDYSSVYEYDVVVVSMLVDFLEEQLCIVFEVYFIDYQCESGLYVLVCDYFVIFKVGFVVIFVYCEVLFVLVVIEVELLLVVQCLCLLQVLDEVMVVQLKYWQFYYQGDDVVLCLLCSYFFSDCCCYYWGEFLLVQVVQILFVNLEQYVLLLVLLSQYLLEQYCVVCEGMLVNMFIVLVQYCIGLCLGEYVCVCSVNQVGICMQNVCLVVVVVVNG